MFKPLLLTFTLLGLTLPSCHTAPLPPPVNVASQPALDVSQLEFKSKIAAQAYAAQFATIQLPDSNAKSAVAGSVGVIQQLAGAPTDKDKAEALAPVVKALAGDLAAANLAWAKAKDDAIALNQRISELELKIKNERIAAALELQRQLDKVKQEADLATKKIISYVFFGGGFVLGVMAVLTLVYASSVPQLGPRAALAFGTASAAAIGSGIAVIQLLNHPEVVWWGLGIVVAAFIAGIAVVYTNHLHHVSAPQPAK